MNITNKLRAAFAIALLIAPLAAQSGRPLLRAFGQDQAYSMRVGIELFGPPNSHVILAISGQRPLANPVRTPWGAMHLGSVDNAIQLRTDAYGRASLVADLPKPFGPFWLPMQALFITGNVAQLSNLECFGAGAGNPNASRAATVTYSSDSKKLTVNANGKRGDQVDLIFYDKDGKVLAPTTRATIGDSGALTIGDVPIPAGATTFKVNVGGSTMASGTLP